MSETINHVTMLDIVNHINIIGLAVGTTVGVAGTKFLSSLIDDIVMPMIPLKDIPWREIKYKNIEIGKFASQLIQLTITIGIVLIIVKYVGREIIEPQIVGNKKSAHEKKETYKEIIRLLKSINKNNEKEVDGVNHHTKAIEQLNKYIKADLKRDAITDERRKAGLIYPVSPI